MNEEKYILTDKGIEILLRLIPGIVDEIEDSDLSEKISFALKAVFTVLETALIEVRESRGNR